MMNIFIKNNNIHTNTLNQISFRNRNFLISSIIEEKNLNEFSSQYRLGPLECGLGIPIGNLYRKVLLSSIPSISIIGYQDKSSIPLESSFLNNIAKMKIIKKDPNIEMIRPMKAYIEKEGPGVLRGKDIILLDDFDIVNKDEYIIDIPFNKMVKTVLFFIEGIGYFSKEMHHLGWKMPMRYIESNFNPIKHVTYSIKSFSFYEELNLFIQTDGRISPKDSLFFANNILKCKFL